MAVGRKDVAMTLTLAPLIDDPEDDPFEILLPDDSCNEERSRKRPKNIVSIQGKLIKLTGDTSKYNPPPPGERKPITEFSRKSRFNLLKRIARIDWAKISDSTFITLTYPDERAIVPCRQATMQRSHFIRYLEKYVCKKVPVMWAKERVMRKSGKHQGSELAHWHLSVLGVTETTCAKIAEWWGKCINWGGRVETHRKVLSSAEHAAFYLAKYTAKRSTQGILEYPPKLTNPGRAWGFLRDELIPKAEETRIEGCEQALFDEILAIAAESWGDPQGEINECYTFLGPIVDRLKKAIFEIMY